MSNQKTYAEAVNGSAGSSLETLSEPPKPTNQPGAETFLAETLARSDDVVVERFEFPKRFFRSGMIGKENQTYICNNNMYGVLDDDDDDDEMISADYPSTWKSDNGSLKRKSTKSDSSVRAMKKQKKPNSVRVMKKQKKPNSVRAMKKPKPPPAAA